MGRPKLEAHEIVHVMVYRSHLRTLRKIAYDRTEECGKKVTYSDLVREAIEQVYCTGEPFDGMDRVSPISATTQEDGSPLSKTVD